MIRLTNEGQGPERVRSRIRYLELGALTTSFQPLLVCPNCVDILDCGSSSPLNLALPTATHAERRTVKVYT